MGDGSHTGLGIDPSACQCQSRSLEEKRQTQQNHLEDNNNPANIFLVCYKSWCLPSAIPLCTTYGGVNGKRQLTIPPPVFLLEMAIFLIAVVVVLRLSFLFTSHRYSSVYHLRSRQQRQLIIPHQCSCWKWPYS